jgi:hypothetical protein
MGATGAYPLTEGAFIGADLNSTSYTWIGHDPFYGGLALASCRASDTIGNPILFGGPFAGVASGYIGLQFYNGGQAYYGWVRIGAPVTINGGWIYNYAYQTIPNTPIVAGQATSTPMSISRIGSSQYLRLDWYSTASATYQVQYKEQISATTWSNMDFTITANTTNTTVNLPITSSACFYRVIQVP